MHPVIKNLHLTQVKRPQNFQVGDVVRVHYKITEGSKQRIQVYEGTVIAIKNLGAGKTFTVRRVSYDVGVERIFPLYSPTVEKIERVRSNKVRRAKLYFLRSKSGKKARLKEIKRKEADDYMFQKAQERQEKLQEQSVEEEKPALENETGSVQSENEEAISPENTSTETESTTST